MADSSAGEDNNTSPSSSLLLCQEDASCLLAGDDDDDGEEEEEKEKLVAAASPPPPPPPHGSGRSGAVRWILRARERFSFRFQTAYLAVSYLDRFSSRRRIEEGNCWASKLLAVASMSLAAKMEETHPPPLSMLEADDANGYRFESNAIQRMELLVLTTLDWRMSSPTPFPYLSLLASSGNGGGESLPSAATEIIFSAIEAAEMNLSEFRPSAIAAAAALAASSSSSGMRLSPRPAVESELGFLLSLCSPSSSSSPAPAMNSERDHLFTCYALMVRGSQEKQRRATEVLASSPSPSSDLSPPSMSRKRRRSTAAAAAAVEEMED